MASRDSSLLTWVRSFTGDNAIELHALLGDASFRRYFRFQWQGQRLLAVDAPPQQEDNQAFVAVAQEFAQLGLSVPKIFAYCLQQGFMIIADFGDNLYSKVLNNNNVVSLYRDALDALVLLQACRFGKQFCPPVFDRQFIMRELELFRYWFLQQYLGLKLSSSQNALLDRSFEYLVSIVLEQPQSCVHRDYHCRNLFYLQSGNPGIIDFQDVVYGPITYDVVSLLRDCYVRWPTAIVEQLVQYYVTLLNHHEPSLTVNSEQFMYWFDHQGVQRHLKAIGIFARLYLRDGKNNYLKAIPTTLDYLVTVTRSQAQLLPLYDLLSNDVQPMVITARG